VANQTATSLEQLAYRLFELIDAMDVAGMTAMMTDDVQGVDELSRGWLRGHAAVEDYFERMRGLIDGLRSQLRDVRGSEWGNAAVVTGVVDQTYMLDGRHQRITAPTSMTFRREQGEWKLAVLHSVPI
jgi:ketosteroid isomerase-like protein